MITIIKETLLGRDWGKTIGRIGLIAALAMGMMLTLAACGSGSTDSASQPTATTAATDTAPAVIATDTPETPAMTETTGGSTAATQPPSDTSGSGNTATATPGSQAGESGGIVTEIQGTLREWAIDLSQKEVPAGKVRFTVTNQGQMPHNFTVTDSSGRIAGTPIFTASDGPQTLEADLKPGTYTIICSLPGHAARGQMTELVVK